MPNTNTRIRTVKHRIQRRRMALACTALALLGHLDQFRSARLPALQVHDWFGVTGYDIRAQRDLTAWHARYRTDVEGLEIGVRSAMLRMGVTVANVPLRGVQPAASAHTPSTSSMMGYANLWKLNPRWR